MLSSVETGDFDATVNIPGSGFLREEFDRTAHQALRLMVDHLSSERVYTRQQVYALCSVAVEAHFSQIVDVPYPLVAAMAPTIVFE